MLYIVYMLTVGIIIYWISGCIGHQWYRHRSVRGSRRKRYRQKRRVCDEWCSPHHLPRLDLWPRRVRQFRQFRHCTSAERKQQWDPGPWYQELVEAPWKWMVGRWLFPFLLGPGLFSGANCLFWGGYDGKEWPRMPVTTQNNCESQSDPLFSTVTMWVDPSYTYVHFLCMFIYIDICNSCLSIDLKNDPHPSQLQRRAMIFFGENQDWLGWNPCIQEKLTKWRQPPRPPKKNTKTVHFFCLKKYGPLVFFFSEGLTPGGLLVESVWLEIVGLEPTGWWVPTRVAGVWSLLLKRQVLKLHGWFCGFVFNGSSKKIEVFICKVIWYPLVS